MINDKFPWLCSTLTTGYVCNKNEYTVTEDEAAAIDSMINEAYGTYGLKFTYYKVSHDLERDRIFGEDQLQIIERAFYIIGYTETIPPNVRTYHLQGIMGEDILTINVGISAFEYWSTYGNTDRNTPKIYESFEARIGDIIYLQNNDTFYEIVDVKYYKESFGLYKHAYTLTLRVYKDTKMTIDKTNPTLSDINDPIYKVAADEIHEQYEINDVLKINDYVKEENLIQSDNVNRMNILFRED